ncbi:Hpt domain-containing protein [Solilutibacter silvestris]|uniref:Chemotaxis protein CheA n=1 Tax=Solilutibacter silvestris TaxID=1645665 RepID=A0A2K1PXH0_9GAMM|nr:Hpt domain-containing protein [Lysobacter silvestris]PNS07483.1 Response regulator receiver domain-containing protein [Lysobacter silvestris]
MSALREAIEHATLGWIKPELDAALKQVQTDVEAYVETPSDVGAMRSAADQLRQIEGTLRMLELYAPAMVGEEMQHLAGSIADGQLQGREHEACDALLRATVQLPDYLERLQGGHRDIPIVLLPLLNDLRALRGEQPLGEAVLFAPDFNRPLPDDVPRADAVVAATALSGAPAMLAALDHALDGWNHGHGPADTAGLHDALSGLLELAQDEDTRRMLWVASESAEALGQGALPASMALKNAFVLVARETRQALHADGLRAGSASALYEPVRQLLQQVANSQAGSPALDRLRSAFAIGGDSGVSDQELEHARSSVTGVNRALLDTVASALKEDVFRVKDALDLHLRTGNTDMSELAPQVEALGRIGDTLGMLGLGAARENMHRQRDELARVVDGSNRASDQALLDVAGALLFVDASLEDQVARLGHDNALAPSEGGSMGASDAAQLMTVLIREAIANFGDARQGFVAFVETGWDHAQLAEIPRLLNEVAGALGMLELPQAADYLKGIRLYTEHELIRKKRVPGSQQLDTLADALASTEYYLEALRDKRADRDDILAITRQSLEALHYWPLPSAPEVDEATPVDAELETAYEALMTRAASEPVTALHDAPPPLPVMEAEPLSAFVAEAAPPVVETPVFEAVETIATPAAPIAMPAAAVGGNLAVRAELGFDHGKDEIDDEIRSIFVEEFEEEIANLKQLMPVWLEQPHDPERLRPIRRIFHTLKGSGRLVGATRLGEFSWKVENMLNRVLDGTRPASPAVIGVVETASVNLPHLLAALQNQPVPELDLDGIAAVADRVAAGEEAQYVAVLATPATPAIEPVIETPAPVAEAEPETVAQVEAPAAVEEPHAPVIPAGHVPVQVDAILLEILAAEVGGHVATVESWLQGAKQSPQVPDDILIRAVHTMNGAFAMAEVPEITDATGPAEGYLKRLGAVAQPVDAHGLATLDELVAQIHATVTGLQQAAQHVPAQAGLAAGLVALRDALPEVHLPTPEQIEAERLEAERVEAERVEAERLEAERAETERVEAERLEAERVEAERVEAERLETERAEAERVEAERAEAERVETERVEAERIKAEEDAEYARLEAEYAEQARREHEQRQAPAHEGETAEVVAAITAAAIAGAAGVAHEEAAASAHDTQPGASHPATHPHVHAVDLGPEHPLDTANLDSELLDIFIEESNDLLDNSDGLLARLRSNPDDLETVTALQRDLHTLKGGARMAGVMSIGDLGHSMETLLESVSERRTQLGSDGVPLLERGLDTLRAMTERVAGRKSSQTPGELVAQMTARARGVIATPADASAEPAKVVLPELSAPIMETALDRENVEGGQVRSQEQVRIRADLLERLVNYAGEVAIYRSRLEQQLGEFRSAMGEMEQTNLRLRDQLRRLDLETEAQIVARHHREQETHDPAFDPLELDRYSTLQQLTRGLNESASDMSTLQGSLEDLTRQYETLLRQQSRVSTDLQEGLMRTRMMPFETVLPRLRRVIRQAAGETGKQAQLLVTGAENELDRNVLERMTAPLEHVLRNALAHGIESPKARRAAGKPEEGRVEINVRHEGSEVVLAIHDDGAGIDRKAIRARAEERGLLQPGMDLPGEEIDRFILQPGFSTASEVSQLAGRGVGMDVVHNEIRQLGGSLDIASETGKNTLFSLRLPQTMAVTQAVFVRIGETTYAVPIASVRGVSRIARNEYASGAQHRYGSEEFTVFDLGLLIGQAPLAAQEHLQVPLLLIGSGELKAAVGVDQILGNREIVVKPLGPQLASIPGIFGATVMGDGSVVVILDVAPLARRHALRPQHEMEAAAPAQPQEVVETHVVPVVMVVDDSVTMRKVTGRILERHGYEVITAKDGIDALERMGERVPDLMLLDIEMPRMDGYELATQMRRDVRLRGVPIIMITSRTGEKHRERAFEIGVNRYLGKPYQEPELMRNVSELLELSGG